MRCVIGLVLILAVSDSICLGMAKERLEDKRNSAAKDATALHCTAAELLSLKIDFLTAFYSEEGDSVMLVDGTSPSQRDFLENLLACLAAASLRTP